MDASVLFNRPPRDPARIDRVLAAIREAWMLQPDTRLGQLLHNAAHDVGDGVDVFYVEDDYWLTAFPLES